MALDTTFSPAMKVVLGFFNHSRQPHWDCRASPLSASLTLTDAGMYVCIYGFSWREGDVTEKVMEAEIDLDAAIVQPAEELGISAVPAIEFCTIREVRLLEGLTDKAVHIWLPYTSLTSVFATLASSRAGPSNFQVTDSIIDLTSPMTSPNTH